MYSAANVVTENGDSFIPASQRPDGTWRKARRVKEGYVPQEEVPLYESKGKQIINRQSKPLEVKLPSGQVARSTIPGMYIIEDEKEKKAAKKKTKTKMDDVTKQLQSTKINETKPKTPKPVKQQTQTNEATDPAKRLKNLKKRLREIEALEEKLKKGEITKPEPEQLAKIQRRKDLLMEIHQLEKQI